jgi:hypothetical protein
VDGAKKLVGGEAWIRIVKRCFSPCSDMSASFHHRRGLKATFSNGDSNHGSPLVLTVPSHTCAVQASLGFGSFNKPSLDDT